MISTDDEDVSPLTYWFAIAVGVSVEPFAIVTYPAVPDVDAYTGKSISIAYGFVF